MKTLYLDCGMGAAGDMLTAALLELLPDRETFVQELNMLGMEEVTVTCRQAVKCGIQGTHVSVKIKGEEEEARDVPAHGNHHEHESEHHHEHENEHCHGHDPEHHHEHEHAHTHHHHSSMQEISGMVSGLHLPDKVKEDVMAVYALVAEAESHVHGVPITDIHFHEVGTKDAIADIAAVCLLMHRIAPDEVVVSPIHVGSGQVHCAHGILPVPAPATAYLLKDVPIYGGSIRGELCTPTGAALLKHFATRFGDMPVMTVEAIGYGMGKKDFEAANCVRAMLGHRGSDHDTVYELSCNVDDMTAEAVGFAMEALFAEGALEVYTLPVGMKKSRPGTLIRVMCKEEDREKMVRAIFKHTTTIGVREMVSQRYILNRTITTEDTPYGQVRCKKSSGYGVERCKYEYDDIVRIAREQHKSIAEVKSMLEKEGKNL